MRSEPVRRAAYDRLLASVRALPGVRARRPRRCCRCRARANRASSWPRAAPRRASSSRAPTSASSRPTSSGRSASPCSAGDRSASRRARSARARRRSQCQSATGRAHAGRDRIRLANVSAARIGEETGFEVVGVVTDARVTSIERTPPLMVYVPYWWRSRASLTLIVKTAADPSSLVPSIRRSVHAVDPDTAIGEARPLEQLVDASLAARRYRDAAVRRVQCRRVVHRDARRVCGDGVRRLARRREMNIRAALGAQASQDCGG